MAQNRMPVGEGAVVGGGATGSGAGAGAGAVAPGFVSGCRVTNGVAAGA